MIFHYYTVHKVTKLLNTLKLWYIIRRSFWHANCCYYCLSATGVSFIAVVINMFRFAKVKNHRQLGDGVTIHRCRHSGESLAEAQDESRNSVATESSKKGKAETLDPGFRRDDDVLCFFKLIGTKL